MADAMRPGGHVGSSPHTSDVPMASYMMEAGPGTPAVFGPDPGDSFHPHLTPLTLRADAELRALLQALPTRADMESLASRLETSKDIEAVRTDINSLTEQMGVGEATVLALKQRLRRVEDAQAVQATSLLTQK